jgi:hypothetical protein
MNFWFLVDCLGCLGLLCMALRGVVLLRPKKCPICDSRNLVSVNWVRATILVDGKRAPDSWAYYQCKTCDARLKLHRSNWMDMDADSAEWKSIMPNAR